METVIELLSRENLTLFYTEFKILVPLVTLFLVALALFLAVVRIGKVAQVMKDFLAARGSIWEFHNTVNQLKELEPAIRNLSDPVGLLAEKIDAAQRQIGEMQRRAESERTPEVPQAANATSGQLVATAREIVTLDSNWEKLRELWAKHTDRIEDLIASIKDGRRRLRYDRLPRYAYRPIIELLAKDELITAAGAKASLQLLDTFNAYRPRNRKVSDEEIGGLLVLDQMLAQELGTQSADEDAKNRSDLQQSDRSSGIEIDPPNNAIN